MTEISSGIYQRLETLVDKLVPIPDNPAIHDGIIIWTGGLDNEGKPLIVFPTEMHQHIEMKKITEKQMIEGLLYYFETFYTSIKDSGIAFLADLRTGAPIVIDAIIHTIKRFQFKYPNCPPVFYVIQPRDSSLTYLLKRRLNIKSAKSKKKVGPSTNSTDDVTELKKILVKKLEELYQHINPRYLTSDFEGLLPYSHLTWLMLKQELSKFTEKLLSMKQLFFETEEKIEKLKKHKIPHGEDLYKANAEIHNSFDMVLRKPTLDLMCKEAEIIIQQLDTAYLNDKYGKYYALRESLHAEETKSLMIKIRTNLVDYRTYLLNILNEFTKAFYEIEVNKCVAKFAQKEILWINEVGIPYLDRDPKITSSLEESELVARKFHNGIYTLGMMSISKCEATIKKISERLNYTNKQKVSEPDSNEIERKLYTFKTSLQNRRKLYSEIYQFHLLLTEIEKWLQKIIKSLPIELLEYDPSMNPNDVVHKNDVWTDKISQLSLKYPSPKPTQTDLIERMRALLGEEHLTSQSKLTIYKLEIIQRLFAGTDVRVGEVKDIIGWKYQIMIDMNEKGKKRDIGTHKVNVNEKLKIPDFQTSSNNEDNQLTTAKDSNRFISSSSSLRIQDEKEQKYSLYQSEPEIGITKKGGFHSVSYRKRGLIEIAEKTGFEDTETSKC